MSASGGWWDERRRSGSVCATPAVVSHACHRVGLPLAQHTSARTAAAVSSQELSMPRTSMRGDENRPVDRDPWSRPAAAPAGTVALAGLRGRLGLVEDPGRLQDLDRTLELDVPLHELRLGQGWGPGLGGRHLVLRRLDHDVRGDALAMDGAALRREVARGGEPEPRAIRERDDGLHRPLAEGLLAEDDTAAVILNGPRHDLR